MQFSKRIISFSLLLLILSSSAGIFDICLCSCHNHEEVSTTDQNNQCCSTHKLEDHSNCDKFNYQKADINYFSASVDTEDTKPLDLSFKVLWSWFNTPDENYQKQYFLAPSYHPVDFNLSYQRKDLFSLKQCLLC